MPFIIRSQFHFAIFEIEIHDKTESLMKLFNTRKQ